VGAHYCPAHADRFRRWSRPDRRRKTPTRVGEYGRTVYGQCQRCDSDLTRWRAKYCGSCRVEVDREQSREDNARRRRRQREERQAEQRICAFEGCEAPLHHTWPNGALPTGARRSSGRCASITGSGTAGPSGCRARRATRRWPGARSSAWTATGRPASRRGRRNIGQPRRPSRFGRLRAHSRAVSAVLIRPP
jgi:hypothetical protein